MNIVEFLLLSTKYVQNEEGTVVQFDNGHLVKIKNEKYKQLHKLVTENLVKEDEIISMVLNETLDDVLANIPLDDMRRVYAVDIAVAIRHLLVSQEKELLQIMESDSGLTRKDFAIKHNNNPLFSSLMFCYAAKEKGTFNDETIMDSLKTRLGKITNKVTDAQLVLSRLGVKKP